ncbi:hypothetical protein QJQ45_021760, partial [Haematococcus lacustris]
SSGLFPFSVFKWPEPSLDLDKFYPGALLETGHDILFFWVARMVMMGLQLTGKVPFKQVYLHAMVRDAHGRKMSKTLGNVIDPLHVIEGITLEGLHATLTAGNLDSKEVAKAIAGQTADFPDGIEQCGTDALRFALCAYTTQARDINLDIKRVVSYRHWCNKLYNAIRFASLNFPPSYQPPEQPLQLGAEGQPALPQPARWLLSKLSGACAAVVKALEAYDFATATQRLYSFWQYEVCDVYIEVMKPLMALDESQAGNAEVKRATRDTLWVALEVGLRLLHPFMPFVTEELWQRLPQPAAGQPVPSIMLAAYPSATPAWDNPQLEAEYDYLNAVINKVRGLRNDYSLTKQRPHLFLVASDSAKAAVLQRSTLELATLSTSSEVTVLDSSQGASSSPPLGCGVCIVDDATVAHLLLKGILDPALEVAKLQKKLAEVQGRQEALAKKVSAPGYADKTPDSIRADDLDRGAKAEAEKAAVLAAIADMQALLGSTFLARRHGAANVNTSTDIEQYWGDRTSQLFRDCFDDASVNLRVGMANEVLYAVLANSNNPNETLYDAVLDASLSFGDLARAGALVDLLPYIRDDPKQVMTIPSVEYPMIMYVNWPFLSSAPYNISQPVLREAGRLSFYPDTWQELTEVMRRVNATASDPVTGKPRHALCLPVDYDLIFLTHAVMASIMQTAGPTQGWLFDPLTLEPLTNNTAMQQVLQVVWDLAPFLRTFDPAGSIDMTQCAIAISNPALFKSLNPMGANRQFMGQLTMSILPGSTEVLDRSTMQLVACHQDLCNSRRTTQSGGGFVNVSPAKYRHSVLLSMTSQAPLPLRKAMYTVLAYIGLRNYANGDYFQHNLTSWRVNGYLDADVLAYASVVSDALDIRTTAMDARMSGRWSNPDAGIDVEMAMLNPIKSLLGSQQTSVPRSASSPADFTTAMSAMTVSLRSLRDSLGSEHFREQLWGTTGFVPPPQPPAPPSPPAPPPSK